VPCDSGSSGPTPLRSITRIPSTRGSFASSSPRRASAFRGCRSHRGSGRALCRRRGTSHGLSTSARLVVDSCKWRQSSRSPTSAPNCASCSHGTTTCSGGSRPGRSWRPAWPSAWGKSGSSPLATSSFWMPAKRALKPRSEQPGGLRRSPANARERAQPSRARGPPVSVRPGPTRDRRPVGCANSVREFSVDLGGDRGAGRIRTASRPGRAAADLRALLHLIGDTRLEFIACTANPDGAWGRSRLGTSSCSWASRGAASNC
jgi:hypothetical protein